MQERKAWFNLLIHTQTHTHYNQGVNKYEHAISMIKIFQWFPIILWIKFKIFLRGHEASHDSVPAGLTLINLCHSPLSFIKPGPFLYPIIGVLPPTPSSLQTQVVFWDFSRHHLYECIYLFSSESLDPDPPRMWTHSTLHFSFKQASQL